MGSRIRNSSRNRKIVVPTKVISSKNISRTLIDINSQNISNKVISIDIHSSKTINITSIDSNSNSKNSIQLELTRIEGSI